MQVGRLQDGRRGGERGVDVGRIDQQRVGRRLPANPLIDVSLRSERRAAGPRHAQAIGDLHRLPWLLGDDTDEVVPDDHFHEARHVAHGAFVDAVTVAPRRWRPHDAPVQHARHAHVVHELELTGDHRVHVDARHRCAEHGPFTRVPALRLRIEPDVEAPAADELAVGHTW